MVFLCSQNIPGSWSRNCFIWHLRYSGYNGSETYNSDFLWHDHSKAIYFENVEIWYTTKVWSLAERVCRNSAHWKTEVRDFRQLTEILLCMETCLGASETLVDPRTTICTTWTLKCTSFYSDCTWSLFINTILLFFVQISFFVCVSIIIIVILLLLFKVLF